jgi:hypothetical protein
MSNGYPCRGQARAVPVAGTAAASEAGAARLTGRNPRRASGSLTPMLEFRNVPQPVAEDDYLELVATALPGTAGVCVASWLWAELTQRQPARRPSSGLPVAVGCRRDAAAQDRLPGRPATSCSTGSSRSPPHWSCLSISRPLIGSWVLGCHASVGSELTVGRTYRCGRALAGGRSHSDAQVGCTVWSTTASSSPESTSRSTCSRRRAAKASTVRAAS